MARKATVRKGVRQDQMYGSVIRSAPRLAGKPKSIRRAGDGRWEWNPSGDGKTYEPYRMEDCELAAWIVDNMTREQLCNLVYEKFTDLRNGARMLRVVDGADASYYVYEGVPVDAELPASDRTPASPQRVATITANTCGNCALSWQGECEAGNVFGEACDEWEERM